MADPAAVIPMLIERIAGIAAMAGKRYEKAQAHFEASLKLARELGLR